jgi:hypothetical protein
LACDDGEIVTREVMSTNPPENCNAIAMEYDLPVPEGFSDIYNTNTEQTCAEDPTLDVGDLLEICVREVPPPPDNFECDGGTELPRVIVETGDNCAAVQSEYGVGPGDVYNVNTGFTCAEDDNWDVGEELRLCQRDVPPPPDNFECDGGTELPGRTVVAGDNCAAVQLEYGVGPGDVYNVNTALTCAEDDSWDVGDELRLCQRDVPSFECDGGTELPRRTVVEGDSCNSVELELGLGRGDIYNVNTGFTCAEDANWDVGDELRLCQRDIVPPTDDDDTSDGTPVPTPASTLPPPVSSDDDSLSGGAIAGIVIGVTAGVALLAGAAFMAARNRNQAPDERESYQEMAQ